MNLRTNQKICKLFLIQYQNLCQLLYKVQNKVQKKEEFILIGNVVGMDLKVVGQDIQ